MPDIYYLVSSFPELEWDSDIPFNTSGFLSENEAAFLPFTKNIEDIILINDLYNLESYLKATLPNFRAGSYRSDLETDTAFREPCHLDRVAMLELIESSEGMPDFVLDYLDLYIDHEARFLNMELLFLSYFDYMQESPSRLLREYSKFEKQYRTVIAALRMRRMGVKLDENLPGDEEFKGIITANASMPDFGLKTIFREAEYLTELFEETTLTRGRGIDKIRYDFLCRDIDENPFLEDRIYSYILRLLILDRWSRLDEERGRETIHNIVSGESDI